MGVARNLVPGLYEQLLDTELAEALTAQPELKALLGKLDDEDAPHAYTQFVSQVLAHALRTRKPEERLPLVNRLITLISATDGLDYLQRRTLLAASAPLLLSLQSVTSGQNVALSRPETPLTTSSLLTGARHDPQLEHELRQEMATADRVDILVAFIKWTGLRLLQPAFEVLATRGVPVRIVTTSYMGASDPAAIAWLAARPGFSVKVSYDTERTRLHAKAYHFQRRSGFSTGYIGSANMSQAAMTSGLEWTIKVTEQDLPHILQRFAAEFSTYWASPDFETYDTSQHAYPTPLLQFPFPCQLHLHAAYGTSEIKTALGLCTLEKSGPTGVGVFHAEHHKCYVHLVTFRKSEQDFSPTTQYRDYPISRSQLHWESQSTTTQTSSTGQNLLQFRERGYTVLFFARLEKRIEDETAPFIFLGPAERLLSAEGNRPIAIVWELAHHIPAALFEEARAV
jgi:HKD family nuclease